MTTVQQDSYARNGSRLSILTGDRLCPHCGYNLNRQSVLRDPHYGLLIVRCPECSAVDALGDHAWLGHWAGRTALTLAILWWVVMLAVFLMHVWLVGMLSLGTAEVAQPWQNSSDPIKTEAFFFWVPLCTSSFLVGCFWSIALAKTPAWRRVLLLLVHILLLGVFGWIQIRNWELYQAQWSWNPVYYQTLAPLILFISMAASLLTIAIGWWLGAPLQRRFVKAALPLRLQRIFLKNAFSPGRA